MFYFMQLQKVVFLDWPPYWGRYVWLWDMFIFGLYVLVIRACFYGINASPSDGHSLNLGMAEVASE